MSVDDLGRSLCDIDVFASRVCEQRNEKERGVVIWEKTSQFAFYAARARRPRSETSDDMLNFFFFFDCCDV